MRLSRRDVRFLVVCLAVSAVSGWLGVRYYDRVFPEATITFDVGREATKAKAEAFLRTRGLSPESYRHAVAFQYDEEAKTFLERELGAERAGALADGPLRLWRWAHRWYLPLQKEELAVSFSTRGQLTGFVHEIPEDAPGERLSEADARREAERFLDVVWPHDRPLEFVLHSQEDKPHRLDHTFVWKDPAYAGEKLLGRDEDAQYRVEVTVHGSHADGLREHLKPPEAWQRDYEHLRSRNQVAQMVDLGLNFFLLIGLLVVLVQRLRARDVQWRFALGLAGVGSALVVLAGFNGLPLKFFFFDTNSSLANFVGQQLVSLLRDASLAFLGYALLAAGAEPLMRERAPNQLALPRLFSVQALRTRSLLIQLVLGFTLTFFFFAYENGFYLVAQKLGAWSPRDVPYDDLLNSKMPWAFVVSFGFAPAISEEFIWRLFAIPFLLKLTRNPVVAIVIPAFLWGFGHAGYPQQPFWIRGVEVGVVGIVAGLVFLRFGVVTTVVWHFTTDAFYSALILLRSHDVGHVISGAVGSGILLVPLAAAFVLYFVRGGFASEEGVRNGDLPRSPASLAEAESDVAAPPEAAGPPPWISASTTRLAIATVIGLLLLGIRLLPMERWGDFAEFRLSPADARARAKEALRSLGVTEKEVARARVAVGVSDAFEGPPRPITMDTESPYKPPPSDEPQAARYLVRHAGVAVANRQYGDKVRAITYTVRFYREREPVEEWLDVDVRSGALAAYERHLPEDAPGPSLSPEQALPIAQAGLVAAGFSAADFTLKEQTSEKRKSRTDHRFVFEETKGPSPDADLARLRVAVEAQGDHVGKIERWQYAPEDWVREDKTRTWVDTARNALIFALFLGLGLIGLLLLIAGIRRGQVRWKPALLAGSAAAVLTLVAQMLDLPSKMLQYPTSMELSLFTGMQTVGVALVAAGVFLVMAASVGLATSLQPVLVDAWRSSARGAWLSRSAFTAVAGLATLGGVGVLRSTVVAFGTRWGLVGGVHPLALAASTAPGFEALNATVQGGVVVGAVAVVAWMFERYLRNAFLQGVALVVAAAILVTPDARTGAAWLTALAAQLVLLGGAYAVARWVLRRDLAAYALLAVVGPLSFEAVSLFAEPSSNFRLQGLVPVAAALAVLAWALWPRRVAATR